MGDRRKVYRTVRHFPSIHVRSLLSRFHSRRIYGKRVRKVIGSQERTISSRFSISVKIWHILLPSPFFTPGRIYFNFLIFPVATFAPVGTFILPPLWVRNTKHSKKLLPNRNTQEASVFIFSHLFLFPSTQLVNNFENSLAVRLSGAVTGDVPVRWIATAKKKNTKQNLNLQI